MCYCKFVFYFYYKQPFSITMETKRLHFDSPLCRECCTHTHTRTRTDVGIVLLSAPATTYHCHFCRTSDVNARYTCNCTAQMQHTTHSYRLMTKNLTSGVHTLNSTQLQVCLHALGCVYHLEYTVTPTVLTFLPPNRYELRHD